jgi:hypothetical protein
MGLYLGDEDIVMNFVKRNMAAETPGGGAPAWPEWMTGMGVVLLALLVRLTALTRAPLYVDSVAHINRARAVLSGNLFIGMLDQKWLYTVVLAGFDPTGPESVWVARSLSALSAAVTVAACIGIGKRLGFEVGGRRLAWKTGLLAGLVYALLPMAVFHERQALVDPMMSAFAGLMIVITMWQSRRPRLWLIAPLAVALIGVPLTKFIGLPFMGIPLVGAVLLPRDGQTRRRALIYNLIAIAAAGLVVAGIYWWGGQSGTLPHETHRVSADSILLLRLGDPLTGQLLQGNFEDAAETLTSYVGVAILALAGLVQIWVIAGVAWREALYVSVPGIAYLAIPMMVRQVTDRGYMPPRYLLPYTMPLVALAIFSLIVLLNRTRGLRPVTSRLILIVVLAEIMIPSIRFDAITISTPVETPFTSVDLVQYLENYDYEGMRQVADVLVDEWKAGGRKDINVLGCDPGPVQAYVGTRPASWSLLHEIDEGWYSFITRGLAADEAVYLFCREGLMDKWENPDGARMDLMGVYGSQYLFRITGAEGELADQVYEREAGEPDFMDGDYDLLAGVLNADPTERTVLVFPASHAPDLAERIDLPVQPVEVDRWPLTPDVAEAAIQALDLGEDGRQVDTVIVNEQESDPAGALAFAFQQRLYRMSEQDYYGVFHQRRFATGPANPALDPVNAVFEDAIALPAAGIVDGQAAPGGLVRVALDWQTSVPVEDSFNVFVHITGGDETILAQLDSIPGGGLLPMTIWEPGETIHDRFAIPLPPDAQPGEYEVRIGIYNPANGLRLRVTEGSSAPDYAVIGHVTVAP